VSKKVPWHEWERIAYIYQELAEKRGEALGRVWMVIESQIQDPGLANTLRLAIIGDFIPDIAVYEVDDDEETYDEVDEEDLVDGDE
jgi:hypothetical protein